MDSMSLQASNERIEVLTLLSAHLADQEGGKGNRSDEKQVKDLKQRGRSLLQTAVAHSTSAGSDAAAAAAALNPGASMQGQMSSDASCSSLNSWTKCLPLYWCKTPLQSISQACMFASWGTYSWTHSLTRYWGVGSQANGQRLFTGTGRKPSVTKPDQVTLAPGQSIQERIGFGLQQHSSSNTQGRSSLRYSQQSLNGSACCQGCRVWHQLSIYTFRCIAGQGQWAVLEH